MKKKGKYRTKCDCGHNTFYQEDITTMAGEIDKDGTLTLEKDCDNYYGEHIICVKCNKEYKEKDFESILYC
jgi:hypothetical protein